MGGFDAEEKIMDSNIKPIKFDTPALYPYPLYVQYKEVKLSDKNIKIYRIVFFRKGTNEAEVIQIRTKTACGYGHGPLLISENYDFILREAKIWHDAENDAILRSESYSDNNWITISDPKP